ncbi:MAG: SulP family inorganic anion transporter [Casimicrobiaceae bacterium]
MTVGCGKDWLREDVVAGLTAAALVIPIAMAHATIAGLPAQVGLYTAMLPMAIYALFGTSRQLSVGTTSTLAVLTLAQLQQTAAVGDPAALASALATLTLLVGAILFVASILRLGFVANFISEPVLIGFKAGVALVILLGQLPQLLGIDAPHGSFVHRFVGVVLGIPRTALPTLAVGTLTIALLLGIRRGLRRAPAPLIVVAIGIAGMYFLGLQAHGIVPVGPAVAGLPSFKLPDFSLAERLWPGALGIAVMSFTETVAAGRAFARSGEPSPVANRELLATGLANAGGALFGAMPAGGGTTQTAMNRMAGARTRRAGFVTAMVTLLTIVLLGPILALIPQVSLAAVVVVYSTQLLNPAEFRAILRVRRTEFAWALIALVGVVLLGTLRGVEVAIVVSLITIAQQIADPQVRELGRKPQTNVFRPRGDGHPDDETFPGLLMIRIEGRVFFANAARVAEKIGTLVAKVTPRVVAIDASGVPDLEYTALKMLIDAERRLRETGVSVWLVGLNPEVLSVVQRSPLATTLGRERMYFSLELAVATYLRAAGHQDAR